MGVISNIRKRINQNKKNKKSEELIKKLIDEINEINKDNDIEPELKRRKKMLITTKFLISVKNGSIIINGANGKDVLEVVEKGLKDRCSEIPEIIDDIRTEEMIGKITNELYKTNADLEKIENTAIDFYKKYSEDDRNFDINPLSRFEKYYLICSYFDRGIDEYKSIYDNKRMLDILYERQVMNEIMRTKDTTEQLRIYEEYVRDFSNGIENPESSHIVYLFKDSEFIQLRDKCKKTEVFEIEKGTISELDIENELDNRE